MALLDLNSNNHSLPCDESCTAGCSLECLCSWRLVHHWKGDYEVGTRLQIWKSAHIFNVFFAHLENGGRFFSTKLPNPVARALVFCLGISAFRTQCDDEDVKNIEFDQLDHPDQDYDQGERSETWLSWRFRGVTTDPWMWCRMQSKVGAIVQYALSTKNKNCECCPGHYLIANH